MKSILDLIEIAMSPFADFQRVSFLKGLSLLLVLFALVKAFLMIRRYRRMFKFFNRLPGIPEFHWLYGNVHKTKDLNTEDWITYYETLMFKHRRYMTFFYGSFQPVLLLYHPDTVKVLLKTSEPKAMKAAYNFALPWLGEGLLIASGERWARARRLLTPAFHFDILKPYIEIFNQSANVLLEKIRHFADSDQSFDIFSHLSLCTLEIIMKCAMSYDDDIQMKGDSHPYVVATNELSELWIKRVRNPFLHPDAIFFMTKQGRQFRKHCHYVRSVSEAVIASRRRKLVADNGRRKKKQLDFLDILLTAKDETGQGLTPVEIRNEVTTFMFAGQDTTASAISWTIYSLATHPEVQEKVREEIDAVLDGRDKDDIEWEDLNNLPYLTCVIKEGMRLHCPVVILQRQLTQPMTIDDVTLPVGTVCGIHLMNLHHHPDIWDDPWAFKPERFFPENVVGRHQYAFVPFSAGPRNCIGQHFAMNEGKVLLARILHRYCLTLDRAYPVKRKSAAVMLSESGIRVFAKPRISRQNIENCPSEY